MLYRETDENVGWVAMIVVQSYLFAIVSRVKGLRKILCWIAGLVGGLFALKYA